MTERPLELADILRRYVEPYRRCGGHLISQQKRAVRSIVSCRTAELGGHRLACDRCGSIREQYNSCGDRHCPKCQHLAKHRWLESRRDELLPVSYFHVVFTVPSGLKPLFLRAPRRLYAMLLQSAGESLVQVARDPEHLGARIGLLAVLHTWGQQLQIHPHVHCIVPGGGLSPDRERWIASRDEYLLPVKLLSKVFRGKLLAAVERAARRGEALFPDDLDPEGAPSCHRAWLDGLHCQPWVVYSKPPFGGAEKGLGYLARYSHRVAISNERLLRIENDRVVFRYKDYRAGGAEKVTRLDAVEFVRRFLQHVLPPGFQRIRYYGLLANRYRQENLERCRHLLGAVAPEPAHEAPERREDWQEQLLKLTGVDPRRCPDCGEGRLVVIEALAPEASWVRSRGPPTPRGA